MFSATRMDETLHNQKTATSGEEHHDVRDAAYQAGRRVLDFIHTSGDEIAKTTETMTAHIRHKPVQSSLAAIGIGFVLGALFRR